MSTKIFFIYLIPTIVSLGLMWFLVFSNTGRKITYYAMLFLSAFIADIGYLFLALSKSAEDALLATKITYLSGTYVTLFLILCMLDVVNFRFKKALIGFLVALNTEVLVSAFTAGFIDWHYISVEFHRTDSFSYLAKEYGPHHLFYFIVIIINMLVPIALLIYRIMQKNKVSWKYTMYYGIGQIMIIIVYFSEKALGLKVDLMPLCFMFVEGMITYMVYRSGKYDVTENVSISARDYKNVGHIILNPRLDYMGCDGIVPDVFPELVAQDLDTKISIPFFTEEINEWILSSAKENVAPRYAQIKNIDIKLQAQAIRVESSDKVKGFVVRIIDDTLNQAYIRKLKESTETANKMAAEADAANRSKSAFLAQMSHEIRSPLNAILGFNELIGRETSEEAIRDYSKDISSSGVTLQRLLNDLLDLSKIEAGKMELVNTEYSFFTALGRVTSMATPMALNKGLKIITKVDSSLPKTIIGDEARMMEILTNIIVNAVKYTHEGTITITVNHKKVTDTRIVLIVSVKDTGIGMKPETIDHLFTPYERIDQMKNRFIEGTGLGMSITQKLLQLMGTSLEVESIYGVGSDFHFSVPCDVADRTPSGEFNVGTAISEDKPSKYEASVVAPDAHILTVDDTEVNLNVFKGLLKETKVQIDTAKSGEEALALCKKNKYDLIFIDHMMPNMDGIETFHAINDLPEGLNKDTPKIALTANVSYSARTEYRGYGFTDYLSKPITPPVLENQLRTYLPKDKIQ